MMRNENKRRSGKLITNTQYSLTVLHLSAIALACRGLGRHGGTCFGHGRGSVEKMVGTENPPVESGFKHCRGCPPGPTFSPRINEH